MLIPESGPAEVRAPDGVPKAPLPVPAPPKGLAYFGSLALKPKSFLGTCFLLRAQPTCWGVQQGPGMCRDLPVRTTQRALEELFLIHGATGGVSNTPHTAGTQASWDRTGTPVTWSLVARCADGAIPSVSGTNFTFFVVVFSGSEDSVSFSCLPTDGLFSSMPSFPALPKEAQNRPINSQQWHREKERQGGEHS